MNQVYFNWLSFMVLLLLIKVPWLVQRWNQTELQQKQKKLYSRERKKNRKGEREKSSKEKEEERKVRKRRRSAFSDRKRRMSAFSDRKRMVERVFGQKENGGARFRWKRAPPFSSVKISQKSQSIEFPLDFQMFSFVQLFPKNSPIWKAKILFD